MKSLAFFLLSIALILHGCGTKKEKAENKKPEFEQKIDSFNYTRIKPQNGQLYATIVLGSSGLDAFIINADSSDNWELIKSMYGESNIITDEAASKSNIQQMGSYIEEFEANGVRQKNTYLVVSSSAVKNNSVKSLISHLDTMDYIQTKIVSEDEESFFALKALLPPEFIDEAYTMDIGSGNTKLSWFEDAIIESEIMYGSNFHLNNLDKEEVLSNIKKSLKSIPEKKRNFCFIIGGAVYEIIKNERVEGNRYTVLKDLNTYSPETKKGQNGLMFLSTMEDELKTQNFIFDWESNFGIGYLLTIN